MTTLDECLGELVSFVEKIYEAEFVSFDVVPVTLNSIKRFPPDDIYNVSTKPVFIKFVSMGVKTLIKHTKNGGKIVAELLTALTVLVVHSDIHFLPLVAYANFITIVDVISDVPHLAGLAQAFIRSLPQCDILKPETVDGLIKAILAAQPDSSLEHSLLGLYASCLSLDKKARPRSQSPETTKQLLTKLSPLLDSSSMTVYCDALTVATASAKTSSQYLKVLYTQQNTDRLVEKLIGMLNKAARDLRRGNFSSARESETTKLPQTHGLGLEAAARLVKLWAESSSVQKTVGLSVQRLWSDVSTLVSGIPEPSGYTAGPTGEPGRKDRDEMGADPVSSAGSSLSPQIPVEDSSGIDIQRAVVRSQGQRSVWDGVVTSSDTCDLALLITELAAFSGPKRSIIESLCRSSTLVKLFEFALTSPKVATTRGDGGEDRAMQVTDLSLGVAALLLTDILPLVSTSRSKVLSNGPQLCVEALGAAGRCLLSGAAGFICDSPKDIGSMLPELSCVAHSGACDVETDALTNQGVPGMDPRQLVIGASLSRLALQASYNAKLALMLAAIHSPSPSSRSLIDERGTRELARVSTLLGTDIQRASQIMGNKFFQNGLVGAIKFVATVHPDAVVLSGNEAASVLRLLSRLFLMPMSVSQTHSILSCIALLHRAKTKVLYAFAQEMFPQLNSIAEGQAKWDATERELKGLRETSTRLRSDNEDMGRERAQLTSAIEKIKAKLSGSKSETKRLESDLSFQSSNVRQFQQQLKKTQDDLGLAITDRARLTNELEGVTGELSVERKRTQELEKQRDIAVKRVAELQEGIMTLNEDFKALQEREARTSSDLSDMRKKETEASAKLVSAEGKVVFLTGQVDDLLNEKQELQDNVDRITTTNTALGLELESANKIIETQQKEAEGLKQFIEEQRKTIERQSNESNQMENKWRTLSAIHDQLQKAHGKEMNEKERLGNVLAKREQELDLAKADLNVAAEDINKKIIIINDMEYKLRDATSECLKLKQALRTLSDSMTNIYNISRETVHTGDVNAFQMYLANKGVSGSGIKQGATNNTTTTTTVNNSNNNNNNNNNNGGRAYSNNDGREEGNWQEVETTKNGSGEQRGMMVYTATSMPTLKKEAITNTTDQCEHQPIMSHNTGVPPFHSTASVLASQKQANIQFMSPELSTHSVPTGQSVCCVGATSTDTTNRVVIEKPQGIPLTSVMNVPHPAMNIQGGRTTIVNLNPYAPKEQSVGEKRTHHSTPNSSTGDAL